MAANKEAPYAEFGKKLMGLRKKAGMTRAELGEICDVAPSTIVNYERGTRIPYADTALKMADYFHISVHDLLGVEDPELAMAQAEALDQMRSINGKKGADRLNAVLQEAEHLAGGELSEEVHFSIPQVDDTDFMLYRYLSYGQSEIVRGIYGTDDVFCIVNL